MKWKSPVLLLMVVVLLSSCAPAVTPPPSPIPEPSPQPTPSPSPTPPPLPPASGPPLNVILDYVSIKSSHTSASTASGSIYLLLVVTDGYQPVPVRFLPADGTYSLNDYETLKLNQQIFHTASAGNSLKVCILAFQQNDPQWLTSILTPALAEIERGLAWAEHRSFDEIMTSIENQMDKSTIDFTNGGDTLIGYYENIWGTDQFLGAGQYNGVGSDDLRLWFSIWSETQPQPPSQPTLLPDITLDNVDIVPTVSIGQTRIDIITITNRETHPVTVNLKGNSSKTGNFANYSLEVPAEVQSWAVENYAVSDTPGSRTITYDLYFQGTKLDFWSGTLEVTSTSQVKLVEWRNLSGSSTIERTMENTPVTLYVEASGYNGKNLTASIKRVEPTGGYSYETTISIRMADNRGSAQWTARWQEVAGTNLRYVFSVKDFYSGELTVIKRYVLAPDATIDNVAMVSYINADQVRTDTVTISSNESELIVIRLKGYSSVDGEFYNQAVSIPANSYITVQVQSSFETPDIRTITYKLYYEGAEFDSWSGVLEVF